MPNGQKQTVTIRDLRTGDYVIAAKAIVAEVECFASLAIVDFADRTATAPIPACASVEIIRDPQQALWQ